MVCPAALDSIQWPAATGQNWATESGTVFYPGTTLQEPPLDQLSYSPTGCETVELDPKLGLGAKRLQKGNGFLEQRDIPSWRAAMRVALKNWFNNASTQLGGLDWACATAAHVEYSPDGYDVTVDARKAALQRVTASLQDAVDNQREARLEMGDIYVYAQQDTMLKVTTGRRRANHDGCHPNSAGFALGEHCAEYTLEEDGVDGELFMPNFHSPALRIHRGYGVCDTFNLNAIGSNLTLPVGDSLFIRGFIDPENTVSAYQLEDKYLSTGVRIFVHGAERHFDNAVEVSGGESVKVFVRRGTQSREKNPFAPYCVDKLRGEDVQSRSSCRES